MWAALWSGCLQGLDASLVRVEVDLQPGLPSFAIVGLPDTAVRESRERVRAALKNEGFSFPMKRITVNLAPAHLKKEGSTFELAIALALLMADQQWNAQGHHETLFLGELSLKGGLQPVCGILPLVLEAREKKFRSVYVPRENAQEGAMVSNIEVYGIASLREAVRFMKKEILLEPVVFQRNEMAPSLFSGDYADVVGQRWAKKSLEIAAAGGHHLLMVGAPGCGKTMLAQRLPSILPALSFEELLELSRIYSVSGLLKGEKALSVPPFRNPHHTISYSAMVGGGARGLAPGEISLAHRGVLFLDELPEFRRDVLEVLREPLESGKISICRTRGRAVYPASFMLVSAMNPCPCGYFSDPKHECVCSPVQIGRYYNRISGPIRDRIDIHVFVSGVPLKDIAGSGKEESSREILSRVISAREVQRKRFQAASFQLNAHMDANAIHRFCALESAAEKLLHGAVEKLSLNLRGYHRVLKISRTIADLAGESDIRAPHVAQAIQLRFLDQQRFNGDIYQL